MSRIAFLAAVTFTALLMGDHSAFAIVRAAPAPLLAAGIPAFAALGGGAAIMRIVRRVKRNRQS